jgi:hypothetical protein
MQEVLHANIFFFITTIAVILLTIAALMIMWQVWKLSRVLRRLAHKIEDEADEYLEASAGLREKLLSYPVVEWIIGKKHSRPHKRTLED